MSSGLYSFLWPAKSGAKAGATTTFAASYLA
jgi:hypothetical protein